MGGEQDFRLFLQGELLRRCRANPAYSLRAFARALQTDYSSLAKLLKGQRPIGNITIRRFGSRLGLSPTQVESFLAHRAGSHAFSPETAAKAEASYQQLTLDSFQVISDWQHYAILELMRIDGFEADVRWIARRLGLANTEVRVAIERLERIGILEVTPQGKWIDHSEGRSTTIGNEFTSAAFRNMQRQVLEKALVALEEVDFEKRDQTSMTIAIDTRLIPQARDRIKKFRRELSVFLSRGERRDAVYNLGISLYPLTREPSPQSKGKPE